MQDSEVETELKQEHFNCSVVEHQCVSVNLTIIIMPLSKFLGIKVELGDKHVLSHGKVKLCRFLWIKVELR